MMMMMMMKMMMMMNFKDFAKVDGSVLLWHPICSCSSIRYANFHIHLV